MPTAATCCPTRIATARGLCRRHYDQFLRSSDRTKRTRVDRSGESAEERRTRLRKAKLASYYETPRSVIRDRHLQRTFGITHEQYVEVKTCQGEVCAICGGAETIPNLELAVDHDHKTGKIRGLLCKRCNQALGVLEESVLILQKMIDYLQKGSKCSDSLS